MKTYVNRIDGIDDAIVSMFFSKRTWTRTLENYVRDLCTKVTARDGTILRYDASQSEEFTKWMTSLTKWGTRHITMLKFIDLSITVEGLHRGATDDLDSHAKRMDNRIIRSSTRLATFDTGEMTDYYKDKIIPTDVALAQMGIVTPDTVDFEGKRYVKTTNGYILEEMKDNKDVKRGLYMLSIPSSFIFRINLAEFAHVYKMRNINSGANPELKECIESICDQLEQKNPWLTRELLAKIDN